jgi:hypothetical protein
MEGLDRRYNRAISDGPHPLNTTTSRRLAQRLALLAFSALVAGTALAAGAAAPAGLDVRDFTCPLGGAKFTQDVGYPALVLVQFPDGSWLGDHLIDAQIPECPGNGLVLLPDFDGPDESSDLTYRTYTAEQLARLPTLVADAEYAALRAKGRYERALWLASRLGLSGNTRLQLLMRSSWATVDPAERKRRVERFVDQAPALIDALDVPESAKSMVRYRLANALRELGRFEEADKVLDAIVAAVPPDAETSNREDYNGLMSAVAQMAEVIGFHDDDRFPVGLSSDKWAARMCGGGEIPPPYGPLSANAKAACERRQKRRQALAEEFAQGDRLKEDPAALAKQCAATPTDKRSSALANACFSTEWEGNEKAGDALLRTQPREVAVQCQAIPENQQPGPLARACSSFGTALEFALKDLLVADDAAYSIICQDGREPPDRSFHANMACSSAEQERLELAQKRWLADPVKLDAACAAVKKDEDVDIALDLACGERHRDRALARGKQLAADPAAYAAACAAVEADKAKARESMPSVEYAGCLDAHDARRNLEAQRLSADPAAYAKACAASDEDAPPQAWSEPNDAVLLCWEAERLRAKADEAAAKDNDEDKDEASSMADDLPPKPSVFDEDSGLTQAAREAARRLVEQAKADKTYPKRRPGDTF